MAANKLPSVHASVDAGRTPLQAARTCYPGVNLAESLKFAGWIDYIIRRHTPDQGKTIRLRAPPTMTAASFERFLQTLRLLVRIEG